MSSESRSEDLLARVTQHDLAAFHELYDRYAPRVYGLAMHILSSREAAEEVLQEVFVRLWGESAGMAEAGGSVAAWLVVTARELAVQRRRARRDDTASAAVDTRSPNNGRPAKPAARPAVVKVISKAQRVDSRPMPTRALRLDTWLPKPREIATIESRLSLLYKVIDQLPKPQRDALELAVFAGLSETEIAAQTGEPLGKVQRSLRAAVAFVKHRRRAVCGTWAANI